MAENAGIPGSHAVCFKECEANQTTPSSSAPTPKTNHGCCFGISVPFFQKVHLLLSMLIITNSFHHLILHFNLNIDKQILLSNPI
jgi:hypothetical protein